MTRYARAQRDKCAQEGNATPWSELSRPMSHSSNAGDDQLPSKTSPTTEDSSDNNKIESRSENGPKLKAKPMKSKVGKSLPSAEGNEEETFTDKVAEKKKKKRLNTSDAKADTSNETVSEPQIEKKKKKKAKAAELELENGAVAVDGDGNVATKKAKKRKNADLKAEVDEKPDQPKKKKKKKSKNTSESSPTAPKKEKKEVPLPTRPPNFFADIIKKLSQDEACKTVDGMKSTVRAMVEKGDIVKKEGGLVVRKWKTHERQRLHKKALRGDQATGATDNSVKQKQKEPKKKQVPEDSAKIQKSAKPDTDIKPTADVKPQESKPSFKSYAKPDVPPRPYKSKSLSDNELNDMADKFATQTLYDVKQLVNSYVDAGKLSRQDAGIVVKKWRDRERRRVSRGVKKQDNAVCFHCRQSGHQLADCPNVDSTQSGSGICFKCGSTEHKSSRCNRRDVK
uniref:CCHC-type domain-containing protein n=1 Tax=Plectus sambesii TaxID=2011161 RepID=A0A914XN04_9BILA